ncbi:hypothetical protein CIK06_03335 [Plantactinospora sp. KBS50]|nr:hypothetical protein CIK06_03335 [Plantactinospora sp. KBS50]
MAGLYDLVLTPGVPGAPGPVQPAGPLTAGPLTAGHLAAGHLADLVRRSADPSDDVRVLAQPGEHSEELFREVAGLLDRDVLIAPSSADLRHRRYGTDGDGLFDAVILDRATREPVDWLVIQPPALATPLPGWFAVDRGVVRPRTGVVALPLPDGLALATRADFVARRAAAHRLRTGAAGLATVAVTVRAGAFLTSDYRGTQRVNSGRRLAAILADLPLYGADLRLWLTWPSDPAEQRTLAENLEDLADAVGATVWTPPPGGAVQVLDDGHDLRAVDRAGAPAAWHRHRPAGPDRSPAFRSDPAGRLVPATGTGTAARVVPAGRPDAATPTGTPAAATPADPVSASERPSVLVEPRRSAPSGVPWLGPGQCVNAERFDLFVASTRPPGKLAGGGIPSPDLFLVGRLEPRPAQPARSGTYLLRLAVDPGGAIPMASIRSHVPAYLQHLLAVNDTYLVPAGRLDRLRLLAGYRLTGAGRLEPVGEDREDPEDREDGADGADGADGDRPVRIDCDGAWHGVPGLPGDVRRWPSSRVSWAFALVPARGSAPPRRWLRLYRRPPAPVDGHLLLELRVPAGRAIDVPATADVLDRLPSVRSRAGQLRAAGVALIAPSRNYDRLDARRVFEAVGPAWRRRRGTPGGALPAVWSKLQARPRVDGGPAGAGPVTPGG